MSSRLLPGSVSLWSLDLVSVSLMEYFFIISNPHYRNAGLSMYLGQMESVSLQYLTETLRDIRISGKQLSGYGIT